jgi:hypothetical protein
LKPDNPATSCATFRNFRDQLIAASFEARKFVNPSPRNRCDL